jgi:hypothetical protein
VDADDLMISYGGVPIVADSVVVIDADTLEFSIASAELGDGLYTVEIAAGAMTSASGIPLEAFSATFDCDATSPWVAASSIDEGDTLPPGQVVYHVQFSEELATAGLGSEDVTLAESFSGAAISPDAFVYDPATSTATVTYNDLTEGNYTLTVLTSATAFRDLVGNLLDGSPGFPLPSGDSIPGDPFVVHFGVDRTTAAFPTPLVMVAPAGSLIYEGSVTGVLNETGVIDAFTLNLDSGQFVSLVLVPEDASIQGELELFGPGGTSLGVVSASAAGQPIFLSAVPVADAGEYQIEVSSLAGQGPYEFQVMLNASLEEESLVGHHI